MRKSTKLSLIDFESFLKIDIVPIVVPTAPFGRL
jgi:hypothetical protein